MNIAGLLFVLAAHFFSGRGMLRLLRVELKPVPAFCFSMLLGIVIISFAPCALQLMHIPIGVRQVAISLVVTTVLFSIPLLVKFKMPKIGKITAPALYEWPFITAMMLLVSLSVWRCFYFPAYARDMLAGPELLAEYTVREKTMINSVYNIDLQTSNNYFKSPFITCLQIIYKLLVCPFGQLWLSVQFICFITWLYTILKERVHPFLACALLFFFLAVPEMFAYSFVLLYDYSNMVFFFTAFYFLIKYLQGGKQTDFIFSVFLFGFATYIRTETVILVGMLTPLPIYHFYRQRAGIKKIVLQAGMMLLVPVLFYVLCVDVFVRSFVPLPLNVGGLLNHNLADISPFFNRLRDMHMKLIFTEWGLGLYGYFIYAFYLLVVADLVFTRKVNKEGGYMLYGVAVVVLGLAFMSYLLPLVDLNNTTKRGLFKMFPMILLYMANSSLVQRLSRWMTNWEYPPEKAPVQAPRAAAAAKGRVAKPQPVVSKAPPAVSRTTPAANKKNKR